jgi:hypothetical protein
MQQRKSILTIIAEAATVIGLFVAIYFGCIQMKSCNEPIESAPKIGNTSQRVEEQIQSKEIEESAPNAPTTNGKIGKSGYENQTKKTKLQSNNKSTDSKSIIPNNANKDKSITLNESPGSIATIDQTGDNYIITPETKPVCAFFKNETIIEFDSARSLFRMKFFFGSKDGFPLRNPVIKIRFDKPFENIDGGVTGSGFASAGNLQKKLDSDKLGFQLSTDFLHSNNFLFLVTESNKSLKITELVIEPR